MATIYDIERKRKEILLDLKPDEIKAYLKYHINNLYEATQCRQLV